MFLDRSDFPANNTFQVQSWNVPTSLNINLLLGPLAILGV